MPGTSTDAAHYLEEQYIKQDFWLRGELIVVEHVRAGVGPRCGAMLLNEQFSIHNSQ